MIKVIGRELQIPQSERMLGYESDNLIEVRRFLITDKALFGLSFKLDVAEYGCIVDLEKSGFQDGSGIILTWTVTSGITQKSGRLNVQLRAFDTTSNLVWHSEMQTFLVGESVNASKEIDNVQLCEFEQIEIKATAAKEEAASQAELAKAYAHQSKQAAEEAQVNLSEHTESTDNPHGVTAEQVGAYTKMETDSAISNMSLSLHIHDTNTDNPHRVTAKQVGAPTLAEMLTLHDQHALSAGNPHGVTAEQTGAYTKAEVDDKIGDIDTALEELHAYAQGVVSGGDA